MALEPAIGVGGLVGFIDTSHLITTVDANFSTAGLTYTATENCWVVYTLLCMDGSAAEILYLDGVNVAVFASKKAGTQAGDALQMSGAIPVKKGQVVTSRTGNNKLSASISVYKMTY